MNTIFSADPTNRFSAVQCRTADQTGLANGLIPLTEFNTCGTPVMQGNPCGVNPFGFFNPAMPAVVPQNFQRPSLSYCGTPLTNTPFCCYTPCCYTPYTNGFCGMPSTPWNQTFQGVPPVSLQTIQNCLPHWEVTPVGVVQRV